MTYPNKNFMVDFKLFVVVSFLLPATTVALSLLLLLSLLLTSFKASFHPAPSFFRPGWRKTFFGFFELLYMCCPGNERIDPFRRPNSWHEHEFSFFYVVPCYVASSTASHPSTRSFSIRAFVLFLSLAHESFSTHAEEVFGAFYVTLRI